MRVHSVAKQLGITSREALSKLEEIGEFVSSASSTIEPPVVKRLKSAFADAAPAEKPKPAAKPAQKPAPKPQAAKPAAPKAEKPAPAPEAPQPAAPKAPETPAAEPAAATPKPAPKPA